jgi:hypothetical protein
MPPVVPVHFGTAWEPVLALAGLALAGLVPAGLVPAGLVPAGLVPSSLVPAALGPEELSELAEVLPEWGATLVG